MTKKKTRNNMSTRPKVFYHIIISSGASTNRKHIAFGHREEKNTSARYETKEKKKWNWSQLP